MLWNCEASDCAAVRMVSREDEALGSDVAVWTELKKLWIAGDKPVVVLANMLLICEICV